MANWCQNSVRFTGETEAVEAAHALFKELAENEEHDKFDLPGFITVETSIIAGIWIKDDTINYKTRWAPNLQALQQIAEHFGAGFVNRYSERGMGIFGEAIYERGLGQDIRLDHKHLEQISYDEALGQYKYNDRSYESEEELLDEILDAEISRIKNRGMSR